jgi:hypothetical protein
VLDIHSASNELVAHRFNMSESKIQSHIARRSNAVATTTNQPEAPNPFAKTRVGPIDTLLGVRHELARVYRAARRQQVKPEHARTLGFLLGKIAETLELVEIRQRIEALERAGNVKWSPDYAQDLRSTTESAGISDAGGSDGGGGIVSH